MKININNKNLAIAAAGAVATTATGIAAYFARKAFKIDRKFDILVHFADDVYKMTDIEIEESFINSIAKAKIQTIAARETSKSIDEIKFDIIRNTKIEISNAVEKELNKNQKLIDKKIKEEVDKINVSDFKDEAIAEAKRTLNKKLEEDSEKILEKYFSRLDRETELYADFLEKMSNKKESIKKIMED